MSLYQEPKSSLFRESTVSSFRIRSTKVCGLILCQCIVVFVTFVVSCPPGNPDKDYNYYTGIPQRT